MMIHSHVTDGTRQEVAKGHNSLNCGRKERHSFTWQVFTAFTPCEVPRVNTTKPQPALGVSPFRQTDNQQNKHVGNRSDGIRC